MLAKAVNSHAVCLNEATVAAPPEGEEHPVVPLEGDLREIPVEAVAAVVVAKARVMNRKNYLHR